MSRVRIGTLVLVRWWDAIAHAPGWIETINVRSDLPIVQSVGWLLEHTKKSLILAADTGSSDLETNRRIEIPSGMLAAQPVKLTVLARAPRRRTTKAKRKH